MYAKPPPLPAVKRRLPAARVVGLVLLAVGVGLLAWHLAWRVSNVRAVARLEQEARARGEPMSLAELAAMYPPVPEAENSYVALEKLWAAQDPEFWQAFRLGTRPLPELRKEDFPPALPVLGREGKVNSPDALNPDSVRAMREFLEARWPHLEAVRSALKLKTYRADYDFADGYKMLVPSLPRMKQEAQLFQLEAYDAIERHQTTRALEALSDITRVGHCLREEPLLIRQLVRLACYQMAFNTAERLMMHLPLSESELRQLDSIVQATAQDDGFKLGLLSERAYGWSVFDLSNSGPDSLADASKGLTAREATLALRILSFLGLARADQRHMGETYAVLLEGIQNPDYATNAWQLELIEAACARTRRFPPLLITGMLLPALHKAGDKFVGAEARRRCVLTAIAIELYRLAHSGDMPETLAGLGGPVPRDPFSDGPLRYKTARQGYVVYSVGPDRQDNDGILDPPKQGSQPAGADVGFRVQRP